MICISKDAAVLVKDLLAEVPVSASVEDQDAIDELVEKTRTSSRQVCLTNESAQRLIRLLDHAAVSTIKEQDAIDELVGQQWGEFGPL